MCLHLMKKGMFFLSFMLFLSLPGWAGEITGTIKYDGKVPQMREIKMDADPICASKHTEPVRSESLVLGEGNTMANIFVKVTSGLPEKTYPAPSEAAVIDQKGCQYSPHVLALMVGQTLEILNPDGTLHNVHSMSKVNKEFNMAMPKFKKKSKKTFDKEEAMFPVKCDVHPWMKAWITVMSHPYFDVTSVDGTFTLKDLPAGTYQVEAWHEKLGTQTAQVTIGADESKTADFTFSRPQK